jgi:DNA sulfur modification protein DndC
VGIYDTLEKCFNTSSRSPEDAIKNARLKRELSEAVSQGDIAKVKQMTLGDVAAINEVDEGESDEQVTWASMKFKKGNLE